MRSTGLVGCAIAVTAACVHPENPGPDAAISCPALQAPPSCRPHGLAGIALDGRWTLTGTFTDDHCLSGMPTTKVVDQFADFIVQGCTFDSTGQLDDTVAITSTVKPGEWSSMETICVDATTGMLAYSSISTERCFPTNTNPDTLTITGTLTR